MKKIILSLVAIFALASCTKHEFNTNSHEKSQLEKYQDAFVKEFGNIAENQNWGFTDQSVKSSTRGENVNRNEWGHVT